eukprot:1157822-Pelagomonas_calceolata.AAC.7
MEQIHGAVERALLKHMYSQEDRASNVLLVCCSLYQEDGVHIVLLVRWTLTNERDGPKVKCNGKEMVGGLDLPSLHFQLV